MSKIVYILTNQAMPGIIKIGITDGLIEQRIKELDKTSTPLPFECFFAKKVSDNKFIESKMHEAFDTFRIRQNREFFRMDPSAAKAALDMTEGEDVTPKEDVVETEIDRVALNSERNRNRFNFAQIGIDIGTELSFKKIQASKPLSVKIIRLNLEVELHPLHYQLWKLFKKWVTRGIKLLGLNFGLLKEKHYMK